jgi:Amt family ammonium transporter
MTINERGHRRSWTRAALAVMMSACTREGPFMTRHGHGTQYRRALVLAILLLLLAALCVLPSPAQEPGVDLAQDIKLTKVSVNTFFLLSSSFLSLALLLPGFALREAGLTPGTRFMRALGRDFVLCALGMTGFAICGLALMFGGSNSALAGSAPFFLAGARRDPVIVAVYTFQLIFVFWALAIATGALAGAGRWRLWSLCGFGLFFAMVVYPVYGAWVWGGGWLAGLGIKFGLGNGTVDFAGSSVVHMTGGIAALAGAWVIGPRSDRSGNEGSGVTQGTGCRGVAMVVIGTVLLVFHPIEWIPALVLAPFNFEPGSTLEAGDYLGVAVLVATVLGALAGGLTAFFGAWIARGKPDLAQGSNGLLAGAVALHAPCAFIDPLGSVVIGALAGIAYLASQWFLARVLRIDDPVGAISVHGTCGAFGTLALGFLAKGNYGVGWNGAASAPLGLLYGGGPGQLAAQAIGVAAGCAWVFPTALIFFWVVGRMVGNRTPDQPVP